MSREDTRSRLLLSALGGNGFIMVNKSLASELGLYCAVMLGQLLSLNDLFKGDEFFYQLERLMDDTSMSKEMCSKSLKRLEELGLLSIIKKGMPAKNYYKLNIDNIFGLIEHIEAPSTSDTDFPPLVDGKAYDKQSEKHTTSDTDFPLQSNNIPSNNKHDNQENKNKEREREKENNTNINNLSIPNDTFEKKSADHPLPKIRYLRAEGFQDIPEVAESNLSIEKQIFNFSMTCLLVVQKYETKINTNMDLCSYLKNGEAENLIEMYKNRAYETNNCIEYAIEQSKKDKNNNFKSKTFFTSLYQALQFGGQFDSKFCVSKYITDEAKAKRIETEKQKRIEREKKELEEKEAWLLDEKEAERMGFDSVQDYYHYQFLITKIQMTMVLNGIDAIDKIKLLAKEADLSLVDYVKNSNEQKSETKNKLDINPNILIRA